MDIIEFFINVNEKFTNSKSDSCWSHKKPFMMFTHQCHDFEQLGLILWGSNFPQEVKQ